jgi:hypothetical protein
VRGVRAFVWASGVARQGSRVAPPLTVPLACRGDAGKAVSAGQRLLQWIDKNSSALEAGMDSPGEEQPGGGTAEVGVWAEFQKRIGVFARDTLGMSPGAAFSLIGMTAFERELMQRLNNAGVNIDAKFNPQQLRQVHKKISKAGKEGRGGGDEGTLPPLRKSAGELRTNGEARSDHAKNRQTSKSLDGASALGAARSLRQTMSARAHSERMRSQPGVLNVNKETIKEWLREPAIDPEKRLTITHFQNKQWKSLYDAKHDPARIKQQQMERLAASGVRKIPAQTLTIAPRTAPQTR